MSTNLFLTPTQLFTQALRRTGMQPDEAQSVLDAFVVDGATRTTTFDIVSNAWRQLRITSLSAAGASFGWAGIDLTPYGTEGWIMLASPTATGFSGGALTGFTGPVWGITGNGANDLDQFIVDINGNARLWNSLTIGTIPSAAAAGAIRLPRTAQINWRNQAGNANLGIALDATNVFQVDAATTFAGAVTATSFVGPLTGNAATATVLATARTINGVSFNGSANIVVTAAAGTLSGATLAAGVTASSLTGVGTLTSLAVGVGGIAMASGGQVAILSAQDAATPEYTFNGDLNTGMYQVGSDVLGFAAGGTLRLKAASAGVTIPSLAGAGSRAVVADANGLLSAP